MRGVNATMILQIQLVAVNRQSIARRRERVEPDACADPLAKPRALLQHLRRHSAAAVAVTEHQRFFSLFRLGYAPWVRSAVVRLQQRRDDAASVASFPDELRIRKFRRVVPLELRRGKVRYPRMRQQLRQRGTESETVGKPRDLRRYAEAFAAILVREKHLPQQRLARGYVAVAFDPKRGDVRLETAAGDRRANPRKKIGRLLFHESIQLRLALNEAEGRIAFEQIAGNGKRSRRLSAGLLVRPEPRYVEVTMADERKRAVVMLSGASGIVMLRGASGIVMLRGASGIVMLSLSKHGRALTRPLSPQRSCAALDGSAHSNTTKRCPVPTANRSSAMHPVRPRAKALALVRMRR